MPASGTAPAVTAAPPPPALSPAGNARRAFGTSEGHMLIAGLGLALLFAGFLVASYIVSLQHFHVFVGMTATNILFGRAAGMSFGYAFELSDAMVLSVNLAVELILVLLVYSLFVLSWQRLLVFRVLERFMRRMSRAADRHKGTIRRYGIPALFLFVLIPFWMTGPVVGCIIGYFLGMKPWTNVGIVLSATALACAAWALVLQRLHETMAGLTPLAPVILVIAVVAIAAAGYLLESRRRSGGRLR